MSNNIFNLPGPRRLVMMMIGVFGILVLLLLALVPAIEFDSNFMNDAYWFVAITATVGIGLWGFSLFSTYLMAHSGPTQATGKFISLTELMLYNEVEKMAKGRCTCNDHACCTKCSCTFTLETVNQLIKDRLPKPEVEEVQQHWANFG